MQCSGRVHSPLATPEGQERECTQPSHRLFLHVCSSCMKRARADPTYPCILKGLGTTMARFIMDRRLCPRERTRRGIWTPSTPPTKPPSTRVVAAEGAPPSYSGYVPVIYVPRLRECGREVEAEEVSNSRNKIHQTWERPY